MLPVALENATKIIGNIVHSGKAYICVMQLHGEVPEEKLCKVIKEFEGRIYQRPPLRSSVKRALRVKTIHRIEILEIKDKLVLMIVECEAGTYIRKLCHDIGEVLGVGAHMRELRRIRSGPFKEDETLVRMQDLAYAIIRWRDEGKEDLLRKVILPAEYAVSHMPKIVLRDTAVDAIAHGANLAVPGIAMLHEGIKKGDTVALFTLKGELVAIGKALMSSDEIMEKDKGLAVRVRRVIMKPGVYPATWGKRKKQ